MSQPSAWQIEQAMARYQELVQCIEINTDDSALKIATDDTYTMLYALVRAACEAETFADGVNQRIDDLATRKERYETRARSLRETVMAIMDILGESKITQPDFTVSVRSGSPGVVITDADSLPERFIKITRTPDKVALKVALNDGEVVDGVEWSNPRPSLTIRTK